MKTHYPKSYFMKIGVLAAALLMLFAFTTQSFAQNRWSEVGKSSVSNRVNTLEQDPTKYKVFSLDLASFNNDLKGAPARGNAQRASGIVVTFPTAEGSYEKFSVVEASIMHPDLAAKYPGIKSYAGYSLDDPGAMIRFSVSHKGLSSMKLYGSTGSVFIEPYSSDYTSYMVYNRSDKAPSKSTFECLTEDVVNKSTDQIADRNADDGIFRTFRLAMSVTGEYTSFHGGTVADALAAINTTMTRVNGIFEIDFGATMVLIANTDQVIYTNAATDPYGGLLNSQLQSTLTSVIGEANYDVGHLMHEDFNNGNAGCIGCLCVDGLKGSGFSSHVNPQGDNFDVDYVAHEIGHQFGANHTWTFGGNEGTGVQMEPGSGSTIMGYAGITGGTDVQDHSDPYFHAASIEQATDHIKSRTCPTTVTTGNSIPTVDAGADVTVPMGTPFLLSAVGSDGDGDALTYCWEQMNNGSSGTTFPNVNATSGPAFRSFNPTSSPDRSFPATATVLAGNTSTQWEAVPNVARTMSFRVTVRDNQAGGPANNSDDIIVTVNSATGPFEVSSPNTNVTWSSGTSQTVTWDVAGTDGSPVNAANVNILLSTDGGLTYPTTLASGVANDGSESITVPALATSTARVKVEAAGNVFYDVSNADFTIESTGPCTVSVPSGLASSGVTSSSANISWDSQASATSYDYQYREVGAASWTVVNTASTSATVSGLSSLTDYEFQVRAICPDETSAYSASSNFTTLDVDPPCTVSVPTGLTSSGVTSSGADISWDSQASATSYDYQYRATGAASWTAVNTTATSASISGLAADTEYEFQVRAICPDQTSAYSASSNFTTDQVGGASCDVAPALSASGITESSATISWPAIDGVTNHSYRYRLATGGSWTTGSTTASSVTISGLSADTEYEFRMRASCTTGNSPLGSINFTTTDGGTPTCDVPSGLASSSVGETTATISWGAVSIANTYDVRYRETGAASWIDLSVSGTSTSLSGLTADTDYEYQVQSNCTGEVSGYSASSNFTTTDGGGGGTSCDIAPQNLSASTTATTATISWSAVDGANSYTYKNRRTTGGGATNGTVTSNSVTLTGLIANATYTFNLRTSCDSGNSPAGSFTYTTGASRANASASRGGVSDIKFYPNPAENVLKVDLPFAEGSGNVKIFDMKGVMLKNAVLNVNTNEIDLSGMERGVYLINITTENTSLTKRFVKN